MSPLRQRKSRWLEITIAVVVGFFVCAMISWTFRVFALLSYLAIVCTAATIVASFRRGTVGFAIACLPLSACLLGIVMLLPRVFPLQLAPLPAASYQEVPLAQVLADLALKKELAPTWRFQIATRELAQSAVTIEIASEEHLGSALEKIAQAVNARLDWQWHKMSGSEPEPLWAIFSFQAADASDAQVGMPAVTISQHGTFWNEATRKTSYATKAAEEESPLQTDR